MLYLSEKYYKHIDQRKKYILVNSVKKYQITWLLNIFIDKIWFTGYDGYLNLKKSWLVQLFNLNFWWRVFFNVNCKKMTMFMRKKSCAFLVNRKFKKQCKKSAAKILK